MYQRANKERTINKINERQISPKLKLFNNIFGEKYYNYASQTNEFVKKLTTNREDRAMDGLSQQIQHTGNQVNFNRKRMCILNLVDTIENNKLTSIDLSINDHIRELYLITIKKRREFYLTFKH